MRALRYIAIALVVLVCIVAMAFWLNSPPKIDENTVSYKRLQSAEYGVATQSISIKDNTRLTAEHGEHDAAYHRLLNGTVWYPVTKEGTLPNGRLPLIVFSHGFGSMHDSMVYLHKHLAENGFIVAGVDFPLTRYGVDGGPIATDVVNQPGDVSALISHMLDLSRTEGSPFFRKIDRKRIGALGMSLGGLTTTLLSYHPNLMDERLSAAVAVAPPLSIFESPFYRFRPDFPFLMIGAKSDYIVPFSVNASGFTEKNPNAWMVSVDQGSHMGFVAAGVAFQFSDNPDSAACKFVKEALKQNPVSTTWQRALGDAEYGVIEYFNDKPCTFDGLSAMHPYHQQKITKSVVRAFFDMQFQTGNAAADAGSYFIQDMIKDWPELELFEPNAE